MIIENKFVATGSNDKTIKLYSLDTFELLDVLEGHADAVKCLTTFVVSASELQTTVPHHRAPGGDLITLLISGDERSGATIYIWDITPAIQSDSSQKDLHASFNMRSRLIGKLQHHSHAITCLLDMEEGLTLLSGSYDSKICVWNLLKMRKMGQIEYHHSMISCLRLLACKTKFVSGSRDKKIGVWRIRYLEISGDSPLSKAQPRRIFEGCELEKTIETDFPIIALNGFLTHPHWLLFADGINTLTVWDIDAAKVVKRFSCSGTNLVDLLLIEDQYQRKFIVVGTCCNDDTLRVWESDFKYSPEEHCKEVLNAKDAINLFSGTYGSSPKMQLFTKDRKLVLGIINNSRLNPIVSLWEIRA